MIKFNKKIIAPLQGTVLLLGVYSTTICFAGDINAGKAKALVCAGCHGINGISKAPNYPNLAGQKKLYLEKAINNYRTGERNDPIMNAMVAALTDADVINMAAFFSSLARK